MTARNRVKDERSTRSVLVTSTERIMLEDGYAAVTYRNVAAKADVSLGAVQHHFPSLDDLFLAVARQYAERTLETMASALRANPDNVLPILWENSGDEISTALLMEFMALAHHRKNIQMEIADFAEQYRKVQLDALTERWDKLTLPKGDLTPVGVAFLLTCLPRWARLEASFKTGDEGHAEVRRLVQRYLDGNGPGLRSPGRRRSVPRRRRPALLTDGAATDAGDQHKPPLGGSDSYQVPAPLRQLSNRAALSAKGLMHYTRIVREERTRRSGRGMTEDH